MINKNFEAGGKCSTQLKDMNNIIETAQNYNVNLPISKTIKKLYELAVTKGHADLDHSALYLLLKNLKKIK